MDTKKGKSSMPMKATWLKKIHFFQAPGVVVAEGKSEVGVDVGE